MPHVFTCWCDPICHSLLLSWKDAFVVLLREACTLIWSARYNLLMPLSQFNLQLPQRGAFASLHASQVFVLDLVIMWLVGELV